MPVNIPGYSKRRRRVEHVETEVEYETLPPPDAEPATAATYEVGYGKTPVHTRWQPGQSGNPAGRPKGSLNLDTIIKDVVFETIPIMLKGKSTKRSRLEVALRQLMKAAVGGDRLSTLAVLRFLHMVKPEEKPEDETQIPEHELTALENLVALRRGASRRGASDEQA